MLKEFKPEYKLEQEYIDRYDVVKNGYNIDKAN